MFASASAIRSLVKNLSLKTGLYRSTLFTVYPYMFSPQQLIFLTDCLKATGDVPGCVVEAGCAYGATTVFLSKFMLEERINKTYIAIDTFSGFVRDHADHEITQRHKRPALRRTFAENKLAWFEQSVSIAGINNVRSIPCDITKFDFRSLGPVSFCLLDVDFYLPIADALPKIYEGMSRGGIIIVDDCKSGGDWDGALQAYSEFCAARGIGEQICCEKLGIIRK
jgi:hypothetical protein